MYPCTSVSYERYTPLRLFLMSDVPLYARPGRTPRVRHREGGHVQRAAHLLSSSSLLLSSLESSDTKVYEPSLRARLGTASHFCEVVVLEFSISWPPTDIKSSTMALIPATLFCVRSSQASEGKSLSKMPKVAEIGCQKWPELERK